MLITYPAKPGAGKCVVDIRMLSPYKEAILLFALKMGLMSLFDILMM